MGFLFRKLFAPVLIPGRSCRVSFFPLRTQEGSFLGWRVFFFPPGGPLSFFWSEVFLLALRPFPLASPAFLTSCCEWRTVFSLRIEALVLLHRGLFVAAQFPSFHLEVLPCTPAALRRREPRNIRSPFYTDSSPLGSFTDLATDLSLSSF